ncbi:MAG: hypothetical protein AAB512_00550 [Patescibacteria group bacterium]
MGVLDLFTNSFKKRSPGETNYLSLTLTPEKILASAWQLKGDNLDFKGFASKHFHSIDSLINEAAVAIDAAAKDLDSDLSEVVFGLSYYWFEDGKVSTETLKILKNLSDELELVAQAFVPIATSVNHLLKLKENGPVNGVFVGANKTFTEVCLIGDDKVTSQVFKGEATKESITKLLKDLRIEVGKNLPPRIIVAGTSEDSALFKELKKIDSESLFDGDLKVESLTEEEIAKCVAYSQAADVLGHEPSLAHVPQAVVPIMPDESKAPKIKDQEIKEEGFDFHEGVDILEDESVGAGKHGEPAEINKEDAEEPDSTHANVHPPKTDEYAVDVDKTPLEEALDTYESPKEKLQETRKHKKSLVESLITLSWISALPTSLTKEATAKKILIGVIILVLAFFAISFVAGYTISSVQLVLKANSKPQEDTFNVTATASATLDTTRSRIPASEVKGTAADSAQTTATGNKKIGNSAKGEVKVLNWTTSSASFDKGTLLISKGGVKFLLDGQVQVASRSASTPGESTVNVVAQDFGASGNIAGGTEFTFQKYDELLYSAKNDSAFTGGDEKQITVVAQDDLTKLEKSLQDNLTTKAKNALKEQNPSEEISDEAIVVKVNKKQFDKKLDDEASSVHLDMEIEASALIYDQNVLKDLLAQLAQETSQDTQIATQENIDILDLSVKRSKDNLTLSGKYRANLVPKINEEEVKDKVAGKSLKDARAIIKQNADISDVEAKFTPNLILFSSIPKNKSKILIKVEAIK